MAEVVSDPIHQGVQGGTVGRSNENDLCFYTADSLYSVQVFLNMTYILSFALQRYNFQCLAFHSYPLSCGRGHSENCVPILCPIVADIYKYAFHCNPVAYWRRQYRETDCYRFPVNFNGLEPPARKISLDRKRLSLSLQMLDMPTLRLR